MNTPDNKYNEENEKKEEHIPFKKFIKDDKKSRIYSVASIIAGVLSLLLCFLPALGIIFSLFAVAFMIVSRRVLGYFEGLGICGLIIGVFGLVFSVCAMVFENFLNFGFFL